MSTRKLNIALVGAGRIGQVWAEALSHSDRACLSAVFDVNEAAAHSLAELASCVAGNDYTKLAGMADSVDGVIVCTPPASHAEICHFLIDKRFPVLCEKPLTTDVKSARRLVREAVNAGVVFTMASKFRFVEDVLRARSIIESGSLGEVILLENTFASKVEMAGRWNSMPDASGGGVLMDNATHSVDLVRYFLGPISGVQAVAAKRLQELEVEDTVQLLMRAQGGSIATVSLSWSLTKEIDSYIDCYCSAGTLRVGWKDSTYRPAGSPTWASFGVGYDKIEAFRRQVDNFVGAILGHEELAVTVEDALRSVEVISAAYASLEESRWVGLDESRPEIWPEVASG